MNTIRMCFAAAIFAAASFETRAAAEKIEWYDWEPAAFARAAREQKLIMVNVGHEGCTACRFMNDNTFIDPEVISLLNAHFINIQVDSETRPDIGERYSDWAWPATAFMRPDTTQVLAIRGSLRPVKFVPILRDLMTQHAAGTLADDSREPYVAPRTAHAGPLDDLLVEVRAQLDRGFNDERGGWGNVNVLEYAEPTLQFFLRGHLYGDAQATARGLRNAYGFARNVDEQWGGVFYASFESWGKTVKEKRTESQAAALQIFASAYQLTQDTLFSDRLELIARYLQQHMRGTDGLYFASQKDLVPGMTDIDIEAYYALDDGGRRRHGLPDTDHATYTDLNARVLIGFARAFEATGDVKYLTQARELGATLLRDRLSDGGWFVQLKPHAGLNAEDRIHVLRFEETPYLRTQAYMGRALLALYGIDGNARWLDGANRLAHAMQTHLGDPVTGGFYGSPADGTEAIIARRKPLEDNAVAAQFLYLLGVAQKEPAWKEAAEAALRASAATSVVRREGRITGNLAIALELLSTGYVEFSAVGNAADPATAALLSAARGTYEPRKVVHHEAPGRYPRRALPAMYICNDDACSLPLEDPAVVRGEAAKFIPAVFAAGGSDTPR